MKMEHTLCRPLVGIFLAVLLLAGGARGQNLFVADPYNNRILEYTPNGVQSIYVTGISFPIAVAFDGGGNLYAGTIANAIYQFTPGKTENIFPLTSSPNDLPAFLAIDPMGNLYVSDGGYTGHGVIYKITPGGTESVFVSGLNQPYGLAFDKTGDLFEADNNSGDIYEFTNHNGTLSSSQTLFVSGLNSPVGLAFDAAGNLYVTDNGSGNIYKYDANKNRTTFASGYTSLQGLAFDSQGDLFVGSGTTSASIIKIALNGTTNVFASGLEYPFEFSFQPSPALQARAVKGTFQLTVSLPPAYNYPAVVLASSNLGNWTRVATNMPPFTFTDSMANASSRFYRVALGMSGN